MKIASMGLRPHYLLELAIGAVAVLILAAFWYFAGSIQRPRPRFWTRCGLALAAVIVMAGVATAPMRIVRYLPTGTAQWVKGFGILTSAWVFYAVPVLLLFKGTAAVRAPGRRRFLRATAGAALVAPGVIAAAAYLRRENLQFREFDVVIRGLPRDLHNLRIVQLSDIHLSAFVSENLVARAVAMANETKAHLAVVTGDLISIKGDPLDKCMQLIRGLRSDAGIFGCHGNHEAYAGVERYVTSEGDRMGMRFLRQESQLLTFGSATLNLSGVDYQRRDRPYLVRAERLIRPGVTNILLSHNPDVFPVAAGQGFDLTLAGHTHGGQVNFEILDHHVNMARFFTPYVYGRYERGGKSLFVTRGIGTVGAPARLGAPPEVALIRLCAS